MTLRGKLERTERKSPEKCAKELCPKCLLVLWKNKHELTLSCPTDKITCLGREDTMCFCTLITHQSRLTLYDHPRPPFTTAFHSARVYRISALQPSTTHSLRLSTILHDCLRPSKTLHGGLRPSTILYDFPRPSMILQNCLRPSTKTLYMFSLFYHVIASLLIQENEGKIKNSPL